MRKYVPLLFLFGLAACDLSSPAEVINRSNQLQQLGQWNATIAGINNNITGTLTVREFGSYGEADITVNGVAANGNYQWRIYRLSCADPAPTNTAARHLTDFAYPNLVANGSGAANLNNHLLPGALNSTAGTYSVRLRVAVSAVNWNGANPVACGNLQRS